jgi:hypothetical protein
MQIFEQLFSKKIFVSSFAPNPTESPPQRCSTTKVQKIIETTKGFGDYFLKKNWCYSHEQHQLNEN